MFLRTYVFARTMRLLRAAAYSFGPSVGKPEAIFSGLAKMVSKGCETSLPKRTWYGVSPVVLLALVRSANSAGGKASSHVSWSPSSTAARSMALRSLCILSTCPLPFGL